MEEKKLVILFTDLVNSTNIADNLPPKIYVEKILKPYQVLARKLIDYLFLDWGDFPHIKEVRGDEVFIIRSVDNDSEAGEVISRYIQFFILLRASWYLEDYNQERITNYREPIDIGAGINYGMGVVEVDDLKKPTFSGYEINKGKRIEGLSRFGSDFKIVISHSAKSILTNEEDFFIRFSNQINGEGKGISNNLCVYEILEIYDKKIFEYFNKFHGDSYDMKIEQWKSSILLLSSISPTFYWFGNLLTSYYLYRFQQNNTTAILKIANKYLSENSYLSTYFLYSFSKAMLLFLDEKYEESFFEIEKSLDIFYFSVSAYLQIDIMKELIKSNPYYNSFEFKTELRKKINILISMISSETKKSELLESISHIK